MSADTTPSTTPQLGDEMPAPDGRTLRVVRIADDGWSRVNECAHCALHESRLNHCSPADARGRKNAHPFDCLSLPGRCIAVFVDDIPLLAVKGILA